MTRTRPNVSLFLGSLLLPLACEGSVTVAPPLGTYRSDERS
jgi:hypothetical protein